MTVDMISIVLKYHSLPLSTTMSIILSLSIKHRMTHTAQQVQNMHLLLMLSQAQANKGQMKHSTIKLEILLAFKLLSQTTEARRTYTLLEQMVRQIATVWHRASALLIR